MKDEDAEPSMASAGPSEAKGLPQSASATEPSVDVGEDPPAPAPEIQTYIGAQLRAVYEGVASQPIPDRFLELMRRLG